MGVKHLQTYMRSRPDMMATEELKVGQKYRIVNVIVDCYAMIFHLIESLNWIYPSYQAFFKTCVATLSALQSTGMVLTVVVDGLFPESKMETMLSRAHQRLEQVRTYQTASNSLKMSPSFQKSTSILPAFALDTFVSACNHLGIETQFCLYEADETVFALAEQKHAFIFGADTDFVIFNHVNCKGYVMMDQGLRPNYKMSPVDLDTFVDEDGFTEIRGSRANTNQFEKGPLLSYTLTYTSSAKLAAALGLQTQALLPLFAAICGTDIIKPYQFRGNSFHRLSDIAKALSISHTRDRSSTMILVVNALKHLSSQDHPIPTAAQIDEDAESILNASYSYSGSNIEPTPDVSKLFLDKYKRGLLPVNALSMLVLGRYMDSGQLEDLSAKSSAEEAGSQLRSWVWTIMQYYRSSDTAQSADNLSHQPAVEFHHRGTFLKAVDIVVLSIQDKLKGTPLGDISGLEDLCRQPLNIRKQVYYMAHNCDFDKMEKLPLAQQCLAAVVRNLTQQIPLTRVEVTALLVAGLLSLAGRISEQSQYDPPTKIMTHRIASFNACLKASDLLTCTLMLTEWQGPKWRMFDGVWLYITLNARVPEEIITEAERSEWGLSSLIETVLNGLEHQQVLEVRQNRLLEKHAKLAQRKAKPAQPLTAMSSFGRFGALA